MTEVDKTCVQMLKEIPKAAPCFLRCPDNTIIQGDIIRAAVGEAVMMDAFSMEKLSDMFITAWAIDWVHDDKTLTDVVEYCESRVSGIGSLMRDHLQWVFHQVETGALQNC